jgi:hypothetical protein
MTFVAVNMPLQIDTGLTSFQVKSAPSALNQDALTTAMFEAYQPPLAPLHPLPMPTPGPTFQPTPTPGGTAVTAAPTPTHCQPVRSQKAFYFQLFYERRGGGNLLDPVHIEQIRRFEQASLPLPDNLPGNLPGALSPPSPSTRAHSPLARRALAVSRALAGVAGRRRVQQLLPRAQDSHTRLPLPAPAVGGQPILPAGAVTHSFPPLQPAAAQRIAPARMH